MTSLESQDLSRALSHSSAESLTDELAPIMLEKNEEYTPVLGWNETVASPATMASPAVQGRVHEDEVYLAISNNNGKLTFAELLGIAGGEQNKKFLYNILSKLTRQGKITRIRGIGRERIEFYYYDTMKIRKIHTSASVRFVAP